MKQIRFILTLLFASWVSVGHSDESGDILLFIPSIIAASQQTCDLTQITTCKNSRICINSGGFWYSDRCNIDPIGLVLMRRLIGTWDFSFDNSGQGIIDRVYTFDSSSLRPVGIQGDFEISGRDITFSHIQREVTATYDINDDLVFVEAPKTSFISPISGTTIFVPADFWFLNFTTTTELVGLHTSLLSSTFPPTNAAWANKR